MNMKVKFLSCMVLTFMLFTIQAYGQNNRKTSASNDNAQIIVMLKDFYNLYVTKKLSVFRDVDILKNKYFTENFFKKLDVGCMEDDMYPYTEPVLNAQDRDTSWMKSLEVKPVEGGQQGMYKVCYGDKEKPICVTVFIVKINGKYLINDIDTLY